MTTVFLTVLLHGDILVTRQFSDLQPCFRIGEIVKVNFPELEATCDIRRAKS